MKKYILPLLLISLSLSSCNLFSKEERIEKTRDEAITAIDDAAKDAVESAKTKINGVILETMQGANQDLTSVIDSAKADIKESVSKAVQKELNGLEQKIADANRLSGIVGIIAIVAIIICIVLFINMCRFDKHLRDKVVNIVTESERIDEHLKECINKHSSKPYFKGDDFDWAVSQSIGQKRSREYIINLITKTKESTSLHSSDSKSGNLRPNVVQTEEKTVENGDAKKVVDNQEPKEVLYARDSDSKTLSGVQPYFQQGKSIYKLLLANKEDSTADITLVDQDDVKKRILKGCDMLGQVCTVIRKNSEPQNVKVISCGKVEKKSQDVWEVTTPITVELS